MSTLQGMYITTLGEGLARQIRIPILGVVNQCFTYHNKTISLGAIRTITHYYYPCNRSFTSPACCPPDMASHSTPPSKEQPRCQP